MDPTEAVAPPSFFTDLRQDINHQLSNGSAVVLTSSNMFWHHQDRTLAPIEYMLSNGWDCDIRVDDLAEPVPGWPEYQVCKKGKKKAGSSPPASKKPRHQPSRRRGGVGPKVVDIAANGMCLPDILLVAYTSVLTMSGVGENMPDYSTYAGSRSSSQVEFHVDDIDRVLSGQFIGEPIDEPLAELEVGLSAEEGSDDVESESE